MILGLPHEVAGYILKKPAKYIGFAQLQIVQQFTESGSGDMINGRILELRLAAFTQIVQSYECPVFHMFFMC